MTTSASELTAKLYDDETYGGGYQPISGKGSDAADGHEMSNVKKYCALFVICAVFLALIVGFVMIRKDTQGNPNAGYIAPRCSHPIYCQGELLKMVQLSSPPVFNDSKTFVDMPMLAAPAEILQKFNKARSEANFDLKGFILSNFDPAGSEIVTVLPADFVTNPSFLSRIQDPEYRAFASGVHDKWKNLVRAYHTTKYCDECFSSLSLPHPFVVPGGRFREFYYWDTFWIMKGLLVSDLIDTAADVVENMLFLVNKLGFMPNGARCYYKNRSQPPMLTQIYNEYLQWNSYSGKPKRNITLLQTLPILAKEYNYWMGSPHLVTGIPYKNAMPPPPTPSSPNSPSGGAGDDGNPNLGELNRYYTGNAAPRPESYREDYNTALEQRALRWARPDAEVFQDIAAGAETGWDFSTRWFWPDWAPNMTGIRTTNVIPVDLNTILLQNEMILAKLYNETGDITNAQYYASQAASRLRDMVAILFDPVQCRFADYFISSKTYRQGFYISSLVPFTVPEIVAEVKVRFGAVCPIHNMDFHVLTGGIPTSTVDSGQQWDFPNAWSPTEWFAIEGLKTMATTETIDTSNSLVKKWLESNYCGWKATGMMFEKYNATAPGAAGHGGEYVVQDGFGWTNGVVLDLLMKHPELVAPVC